MFDKQFHLLKQEERRRKKEEDELKRKEERALKRAEYEKLRNPQKANFVINKKDSSNVEAVSWRGCVVGLEAGDEVGFCLCKKS